MRRKHNRKRNRMIGYDYSRSGYYFVTICVKGRFKYFGDVYNKKMCVNKLGSIAHRQWEWLLDRYPYIRSDGFVVMPNHVHAVLVIDDGFYNNTVGAGRDLPVRDLSVRDLSVRDLSVRDLSIRGLPVRVGVGRDRPVQKKIKSLSELIGAYKMRVSKFIHRGGFAQFKWQRSFHDHIIRNEKSYHNICNYITNNPALWERDRNNIGVNKK